MRLIILLASALACSACVTSGSVCCKLVNGVWTCDGGAVGAGLTPSPPPQSKGERG